MSDREPRTDAKLKSLPEEALEDLWRYRYPEEGGTKLTYEEILVEIPLRFGFTSSLGALSEFYSWLRLRKRMERAKERADQTRLELIKDGSLTPEDIERAAQTVFTSEALEEEDVKSYVKLATLRLKARKLDQDERRLVMLEARERRQVEAEEAIRKIRSDASLTPEAQRAAVIDKMDEFFGLKKSK